MNKVLLVILDGAAEACMTHLARHSVARRSARSAFDKAKKPNMDMLASNSTCGLWTGPHAPHYNPKSLSSVATLEILGYSYRDEPGRGYLEALGMGLKSSKNSVYVRGNFSFVKGKKIVDRRAGRDENGLDVLVKYLNSKIKSIDGMKVRLYRLVGHRVVLVLTGKGLSRYVSDSDIGKKPEKIKPLEAKAKKTSEVLNKFLSQSSDILSKHPVNKKRKVPANFILLRAAGSYQKVQTFKQKYDMKACSISGVNIMRGISRYTGIDIVDMPLTELENDLHSRAKKAVDALEKYSFVILHINGADTYAHNKDFSGKVRYIERVDREVFSQIVKLRHITIAITSDHMTDSRSGEHVFGPVPFLIYTPEENGEYEKIKFCEKCCRDFMVDNPMKKILSVIS